MPHFLPPADLARIFAGLPQAYLVLDTDLTIVAASDLYLRTTDRTRDDIVGRHILEAFPENPDEAGTVEQGPLEVSLRHVLATRRQHEMNVIQYDIPRPEEEGGGFQKRYWTPIHTPILNESGAVDYIVQTPMDVTESVLKEREADARLRIAMHAGSLGSWEYEPETDIWRRNAIVDEMFGFAPGEGSPVAAPFFARMHPDDLPRVGETVEAAVASPDRTTLRFDYRVVLPDGDVRHLASRGEVLRTSNGRSRLIGVVMDVTADKLREAELTDSLAMRESLLEQKDLLLAEVNHRVKNSLQLVVSTLGLQSRRVNDSHTKAAFGQAVSRVKAITSVHERLYRTDDPLVVDMHDYLVGLCADLAENSDLKEHVRARVAPIRLKTEKAIPVALIVNELVTNALKYAYPEGTKGPIALTLEPATDGMLELGVVDEGVGFAGESVDSGLGMRLVRTMAMQLEGRFDVRTTSKGYHATVTFPERA
ncbi:MAG: PAS domain-containing protein [Fulvimarina manganoxydans]|uniref:sensor histidine kinase n=1 Tax=Fulvimarina manganoxydans TaxID=937218 RepID=UPI00235746E8|nr:histidine kinase dimerization/phosphoacceptor domain -containing protein [Fulvimarina manganoxydans]MCK5931025.1 PAS domain-containing protein [Fulvimarina manganoxydans]